VCTLILAWHVFDDTPIAVVANRDEAEGRPSESPQLWAESPRFVAPRDLEAGGTWMGHNEMGVFVGITNRWQNVDALASERSRGLLVRDALGQESAEAAVEYLQSELQTRIYQPFHIVVADVKAAHFLEWNGELEITECEPGVHVVVNVGADGDYFVPDSRPEEGEQQAHDADRVMQAVQPKTGETAHVWTDRVRGVLGDHTYGRCIHEDGFGTKSCTIIRIGSRTGAVEHADGNPCETSFDEIKTPF
jgi:uncharacterized protein with NRDE domain